MGDDDAGSNPGDRMRDRVSGGRLKLWILLEADRWAISAGIVAIVFAALVVVGALDPSPLRAIMASKDPVETALQPYVGAIITGVTLVVTINQLVLSQELGAVGDQHERMTEAMAFREDVADALDVGASPPDPARFLQALVDHTAVLADDLSEATADAPESTRKDIEELVDAVEVDADEVSDQLEGARFGTFSVVSAALNYNYSWKLYHARRHRNEYADDLSPEAIEALDQLVQTLTFFGPAREHVKTLYFQWELINLSRTMLYAAVPAIVVTTGSILYVDAHAVTGTYLGIDGLIWTVGALTALALLPFSALVAYVLRIATVAKRTLAIGPFILRDTDRTANDGRDGSGHPDDPP
jgi:hypothetical protein